MNENLKNKISLLISEINFEANVANNIINLMKYHRIPSEDIALSLEDILNHVKIITSIAHNAAKMNGVALPE